MNIEAATKTAEAINNGHTVANQPAILAITHAQRVDNKSGNGHRYLVRAQGVRPTITVWDRDADAFRAAVAAAPKNASGCPTVQAWITADTDDSGEFYNVTATPYVAIDAESMFA